MNKHRTTLNLAKVRKHNRFLKNWAARTESDILAELILSTIIRVNKGRAILKGTK